MDTVDEVRMKRSRWFDKDVRGRIDEVWRLIGHGEKKEWGKINDASWVSSLDNCVDVCPSYSRRAGVTGDGEMVSSGFSGESEVPHEAYRWK